MTNDDLRNIEIGLIQLTKIGLRPVMTFMTTFARNHFKPAFSALVEAQGQIRKEYLDLDPQGTEQRNPQDNSLILLPDKSLDDYDRELEALFTKEIEIALPKFKFRVTDFMESNVVCAPEILEKLGPLVDFTGFEDFVVNLQKASSLPTKGFTAH